MLPEKEFKEIKDRMDKIMEIEDGLFKRLEIFGCNIQSNFTADWREVTEIKAINCQFLALEYPQGQVNKFRIKSSKISKHYFKLCFKTQPDP